MITELLKQKQEIEASIAELEERKIFIMSEINAHCKASVDKMRELQGKEFGAVNITMGNIKITHTIPKQVSWDQEKMAIIFQQILESGDKPSNYMKAKLEVPEKMYDSFGPEVKSIFVQARSVKPGKITWKFEEIDNG